MKKMIPLERSTMTANYHTHTWRCNHAEPNEEEYVRHALKRGLKILGFSDHTPYPFPGDYYSSFRMRPELLQDYCCCISDLKSKYSGKIQLEIGLEAEFYPKLFPDLLALLRGSSVSYLILGQHFINNETDGVYSVGPTTDETVLEQYCKQSMEAMQTGYFSYFAHPDLIHYVGDPKIYHKHMSRLFREAKNCGLPLELNFLGLSTGRYYPGRPFLEIAAEENCTIVFGCDAHQPEALSETETETEALALVEEYGLTVAKTVPLQPIR